MNNSDYEIGIVVPTLGTRTEFLGQCLNSIRRAGNAWVTVVCPIGTNLKTFQDEGLINEIIEDPNSGLVGAINAGINSMPSGISLVNWLGDDDLLTMDSLEISARMLRNNESVSLVFGGCNYIDVDGKVLWTNKSGSWARPLFRFGPQLIPQPGSLFKRADFNRISGLDPSYKWAFDLDLLMKLSQLGKFKYVPHVLANFRWHADSLSVGGRTGSVREASQIRKKNLPAALRAISELWEIPIRKAIYVAGQRMSKRLG